MRHPAVEIEAFGRGVEYGGVVKVFPVRRPEIFGQYPVTLDTAGKAIGLNVPARQGDILDGAQIREPVAGGEAGQNRLGVFFHGGHRHGHRRRHGALYAGDHQQQRPGSGIFGMCHV